MTDEREAHQAIAKIPAALDRLTQAIKATCKDMTEKLDALIRATDKDKEK